MVSLFSSSEWKVEPESPPSLFSLDYEPEVWLFEDDFNQQSQQSFKQDHSYCNSPASSSSEDLEDLDEWIKKEPFSDWLEEKIDLPNFENPPVVGNINHGGVEAVKFVGAASGPQDTQVLLQEFENIYEKVELCNAATLTPPQSPPSLYTSPYAAEQEVLLTTLQQVQPIQVLPVQFTSYDSNPNTPTSAERKDALLQSWDQIIPATPSSDVVRELEVVDELVRSCVENMVDDSYRPTPPASDSELSCSEPEFSFSELEPSYQKQVNIYVAEPPSPSTTSNSSFTSNEDDSDWSPGVARESAGGKSSSTRKRGKPYSRPGPEEKRMRKKEQNKNAATRYRQKKKAEIEIILGEEKGLEDKNSELKDKVEDLQREIKYLKGLMRDLFKAKGLIK